MYCLAVLGTIPDAPGDTVELEPARIQSESLEFLVGEVQSIHIPIDHQCLGQYGTHPFLAGQRGGHGVSEGVHAVALGDHAGPTGVEHAPDMPRASERRHDEHRDTPSRQLGNDLLVGQNVAYRHHAERNQYATIDRRTNVRSPGRVSPAA